MPMTPISTTITQNIVKDYAYTYPTIATGADTVLVAGVANYIIRVYGLLLYPVAAFAGNSLHLKDGSDTITYLPAPAVQLYPYSWGGIAIPLASGNSLQARLTVGSAAIHCTVIYDLIGG